MDDTEFCRNQSRYVQILSKFIKQQSSHHWALYFPRFQHCRNITDKQRPPHLPLNSEHSPKILRMHLLQQLSIFF
jgi:hypothetical protein